MKFSELKIDKVLLRAVRELGFKQTMPVQEQAIPAALERRDVMGTAQTGTGKTVAFLLPSLQHLLHGKARKEPRMVVLAPTRELAIQIADEARSLGRFTSLRVATIVGGVAMKAQIKRLHTGADIVVATPGRLMDHMRRKNVRLNALEMLVLDEADRMLDMGFLPDIEYLVSQMPTKRQTMMFSATMPQAMLSLSYRFMKDPVRIELDTGRPPEAISHQIYPVPKHLKIPLVIELLMQEEVKSALVFTRTKQDADILARKLREAGNSLEVIHGDFPQKRRLRALDRFRQGKVRMLIATNVAARGLDIEAISHVINFDVPEQAETYIHRIGRTGRVAAAGAAWTLVTEEDEPLISSIEHMLGDEIQRVTIADFDYSILAPDWARPSVQTILKNARRSKSRFERWAELDR
jgi:ATP-dependent RNA helicase RhlE